MWKQVLPRVGYAAVGLLYVTVGVIAARIAFLGSRDRVAGMHEALRVLLRGKEGSGVVGVVAAGLAVFAAWRLFQAFGGRRARLLDRAGWLAGAVGYGALAWTGARLLLRARQGYALTRSGLDWLLESGVGRAVLQIAGVVLIVAGIVALFQAASGRLPRWLSRAGFQRATRTLASRLARIGLAARGVVGLIMGYFLLRAVKDLNPGEVQEIGGSLRELSASRGGPLAMGAVAVGLVFYGVAMWAVAVARRPQ